MEGYTHKSYKQNICAFIKYQDTKRNKKLRFGLKKSLNYALVRCHAMQNVSFKIRFLNIDMLGRSQERVLKKSMKGGLKLLN